MTTRKRGVMCRRDLFKYLVMLLILVVPGCNAAKKGVLPRDYRSHYAIVPVVPQIIADDEKMWEKIDDYTRQKVYFNDRLTLQILEIAKSDITKNIRTKHQYNDMIGYVQEGSAIIMVDKDTRRIGPGGVYIIPSNVPYDVLSASQKSVIINLYTPPPEQLRPVPAIIPRFGENEIKSLVYKWFAYFDEKKDIESFLTFLTDTDFDMRLSDTKIGSWQDFQDWYAAWLKKIKTNVHKIEYVKVSSNGKGQYIIELSFTWKATTYDSGDIEKRYSGNWVMADTWGDSPKIITYIEKELP